MKSKVTRRGFLRGAIVGGAGVALTHPAALAEEEAPTRERTSTTEAPQKPPVSMDTVPVSCEVNGAPTELTVHPDDDTLDVVRETLGLTGSKRACGHGACGACTMLVDGVPHATCLLPATALAGKVVTTIEALGDPADVSTLHPVQRAFLHHDALQCGFCTPGFVVEASAFYEQWRALNGATRPDRDAIAAALAGHLCRCGAYLSIYEAVGDACEGKFDGPEVEWDRADGLPKVTGRAKYTVDTKLPGQLEAGVLRSPVGHAIVRGLDVAAAEALDGVEAVVRFVEDGGRLRYAGQEIAAVAAVDRRVAAEALRLLKPDLEILKSVSTPEQALADDAPPVYPTAKNQSFPNATEGPLLPASLSGNLRGPTSSSALGKPRKAKERIIEAREAGRLVEGTWNTQVQVHTALEPHAAVARWIGEDALEVYLSTQSCSFMQHEIADLWGLKRENVRVLCEYVGGGFGAKATLQMETRIAVELARAAGSPVRVAHERAAEIAVGGNRPEAKVELAVAWDEAGDLYAVEARSYNNAGVAVGTNSGMLMRLPYPSDYKSVDDYDVITHAAPGKPLRGPGGPAAYFALEQTVDMVAAKLGEDPIALRRRWDPHPSRQKLYDWADALPEWQARTAAGADTGRYKRGIGAAIGTWFIFLSPKVEVKIDASADGLVASSACQDMGNGSKSVVSHVIGEVLGVPHRDVDVRFGDSQSVYGPMSGGSRTTPSIAPAAVVAAEALKDELLDIARRDLRLKDVQAVPGGLTHRDGRLSWHELLSFTGEPVSVVGRRPRDPGGYFIPFTVAELRLGKELSGSLHITEVEVDTLLGKTRVIQSWAGIGAGHIVVPRLARSQIEGGVIQGISYALYEERRLDPGTAGLLTAGLEDYRIAGIGDVGDVHVHFEESGFEGMLDRVVGISELSTVAVAASVANAVHNATGWRPTALPLGPDLVLKGLNT